MNQSTEEKNKTLVLNAFETLFNKRDYAVAERYWSPEYIQQINPTVTPSWLATMPGQSINLRGLIFYLSCHPGLIKKPPTPLFG